jgi:molybdopterin/thiamine biosynthesis adenylyltransferase
VKAITQKFSPINQLFYYDAYEVLPLTTFKPLEHLSSIESLAKFANELYKEVKHRSDGLRIILGAEVVERLAQTRLFMVGAGAIGCELLKNYAMLGVGTGKPSGKTKQGGQIVLTDPDVIEVSNLNRQFLFREKHLRKPKSSTAAAAAVYMNRELRDNIVARLDKVHEGTANIFTD